MYRVQNSNFGGRERESRERREGERENKKREREKGEREREREGRGRERGIERSQARDRRFISKERAIFRVIR